jgi:hypothetical protein
MESLHRSLEDLQVVIKSSEVKVIKCKEAVELQHTKIKNARNKASGDGGSSKQFSQRLEYGLQKNLKDAQIALGVAQADSVVASRRAAVTQDTLALLHSLVDIEKTAAALKILLYEKSKARLHSQVIFFTQNHDEVSH